jgi:metallo-beta-lactamase family protein
VDGAAEVKIHGHFVPVRARVVKIDSMSAHADRAEIMRWLRTLPKPPERTYLVHGEPGPMDALKAGIEEQLGWTCHTPQHRETIEV